MFWLILFVLVDILTMRNKVKCTSVYDLLHNNFLQAIRKLHSRSSILWCDLSLGNFLLFPITNIWSTWIFWSLFKWWMMIWYPQIFESLSNKAPAVDHFFFKETEIIDQDSLDLIIIRWGFFVAGVLFLIRFTSECLWC